MTESKADLSAIMDRVARRLAASPAEATRDEVTSQAVSEIAGTEMASLSITHVNGHMDSIAATHPEAAQCDKLRDALTEGPCRDVANQHKVVIVADLEHDDRYPRYGPRAAELGVRSELAVDVFVAGASVMALNLYSRELDAFAESQRTAEVFASQASVAIGLSEQAEHMSKSAATRGQIGQSIGLVMQRYNLNEARAFGFLVRLSRDQNIKMRDLAAAIINQHNEQHPD